MDGYQLTFSNNKRSDKSIVSEKLQRDCDPPITQKYFWSSGGHTFHFRAAAAEKNVTPFSTKMQGKYIKKKRQCERKNAHIYKD
ncbi:ANM_HP_G0146310.mRNA.1.CDS.1 [Saccharomyces cerevisiae]|nr:ANM_HP_G0146310.mRNA.1.CDS.1 [Saccharomyces cerevisiae]CAI6800233.1 ANM_HP_G0146310.mRNA.1.CDS.1 [Saccharomyces cerevisiae]CAI6872514.1 ANM_collapsed_G0048000.mRNA.1.CDS.1 [Saccharomyces cerevisiae]